MAATTHAYCRPWLLCSALVLVWTLDRAACARQLIKQYALPDYNIYHHYKDVLKEVSDIVAANPTLMRVETHKEKEGNYAAELQVVTVEVGGTTNLQQEKARLLLDFGEHGREYVSVELGLRLMRTLADPAAIKRVLGDPERGERLYTLLQGTVFKILPLENEGGRALVEGGKLCERKNGRGVDPNRNWPLDWGVKEKDYDPNEEFPGASPFSEPEVRVLLGLAQSFQPHVWLNVHSGMEAMFTPWDHKAEVPPSAAAALAILQQIQSEVMQGTGCVVGSGGKSVGYLAHGTATDYMFEGLRVPMSYTWEIYGDFKADFHDCFRMFNPLTKAALEAVLDRWLKAIFLLVELMPTHPAAANITAWQPGGSKATDDQSAFGGGSQTQQQPEQVVEDPARLGTTVPVDQPLATQPPPPQQQNVTEVIKVVDEDQIRSRTESTPQMVNVASVKPWAQPGWSPYLLNLVVGLGGLALICYLVYRFLPGVGARGASKRHDIP